MQTIRAGIRAVRTAPRALIPIWVQGFVVAALVATETVPAGGASASAGAAFPTDVYFDLKQALVTATGWVWFVAAVSGLVVVRATVLFLTITLHEPQPGKSRLWWSTVRIAAGSHLALLPAATLIMAGAALRYAPFVWVGGAIGAVTAAACCRRAVALGTDATDRVPGLGGFLVYAYFIAVTGATMTALSVRNPFLAGCVPLLVAPFHAVAFLGWRSGARSGARHGGRAVLVISIFAAAILLAAAVYDRHLRNPQPADEPAAAESLMLLGGADSTSRSGALHEIEPEAFAAVPGPAVFLSYTDGPRYEAEDTRRNLRDVAGRIADQIEQVPQPAVLVGHSQAALLVDYLLARGLPAPARAAVLAGPPREPPAFSLPLPDAAGPGRPGGDVARAFSRLLEAVGLPGFHIDAPTAPIRLEPVHLADPGIPRLAAWPLSDSVWLSEDWRRPGEINIVTFTDHVGVVRNARAVEAVQAFLRDEPVASDAASWRGALVSALRYVFEPWRPAWPES